MGARRGLFAGGRGLFAPAGAASAPLPLGGAGRALLALAVGATLLAQVTLHARVSPAVAPAAEAVGADVQALKAAAAAGGLGSDHDDAAREGVWRRAAAAAAVREANAPPHRDHAHRDPHGEAAEALIKLRHDVEALAPGGASGGGGGARETAEATEAASAAALTAAELKAGAGGAGTPERLRWGCARYWDEASNETVPRCKAVGGKERDRGGVRCLPSVVGIGPTKTGTSTLRDWLEIPLSGALAIADGEPRFFNDPDTKPNYFHEGLAAYRRRMPRLDAAAAEGVAVLEKSPHYFNFMAARARDDAPARLRRMCDQLGLVVIVRDPVDRAVSNYAMRVYEHQQGRVKGPVPAPFAQEVLLPSGGVNEAHTYVQAGLYEEHLQRWMRYFPREQFLFLDFDEFRARPYESLLALEDFVGVERSVTEEQFVFSEERGFYCFQQSPAAKLTCAGKDKGVPHPKVDQVVLDKLRSFYVERNAGLEELSGLRLGWLH